MKFNVYGRFQIELRREQGSWCAYRHEHGKCVPLHDVIIPGDVGVDELATFLDDLFHEYARPGDSVSVLES